MLRGSGVEALWDASAERGNFDFPRFSLSSSSKHHSALIVWYFVRMMIAHLVQIQEINKQKTQKGVSLVCLLTCWSSTCVLIAIHSISKIGHYFLHLSSYRSNSVCFIRCILIDRSRSRNPYPRPWGLVVSEKEWVRITFETNASQYSVKFLHLKKSKENESKLVAFFVIIFIMLFLYRSWNGVDVSLRIL